MLENVFDRLDLESSSYTLPANQSAGLIPGDPTSSGWNIDTGDEGPCVFP